MLSKDAAVLHFVVILVDVDDRCDDAVLFPDGQPVKQRRRYSSSADECLLAHVRISILHLFHYLCLKFVVIHFSFPFLIVRGMAQAMPARAPTSKSVFLFLDQCRDHPDCRAGSEDSDIKHRV
jgi:hypothetical protein